MPEFHEWIDAALKHADITGAALARQLTKRLGRKFYRSTIMRLKKPPTADDADVPAWAKPRRLLADELYAIAKITRYPIPSVPGMPNEDKHTLLLETIRKYAELTNA